VHNGCLALTLVTYGAHLGDVLDLGEPEGHAEAAEEDGDERAAVAEGREAELPTVGVHLVSGVSIPCK